MCNPRRVRVSATRELRESWEREVARTVELSQLVRGEARVRHSLGDSVGGPALAALLSILRNADSGWDETPEGFRYGVEDGYVVYDPSARTLEIVAFQEGEAREAGHASRTLTGEVAAEVTLKREGTAYSDGWGGRTEANVRREVTAALERDFERERVARAEQAGKDMESQVDADVSESARANARQRLQETAGALQEDLQAHARRHLEQVGIRCRQAFNNALGQAYRDAILAYARVHAAENVYTQESGDIIEIEFSMRA